MTNEVITNEDAIIRLKNIDIRNALQEDYDALYMAIKALEQISHLIDRPCEACEFRKDNGCCKWDCVFEEVRNDRI